MNDIRNIINLLEGVSQELTLKKLPYEIDDLSPVMNKKTVDIHYNTLTKGYFKKIKDPKTTNAYNIGGAYLHNLLWENLQPPKDDNKPVGEILDFINKHFKSFSNFKKEFEECATTIQGNGWAVLTKSGKCVQIPNHKKRTDLLLVIDMWEHAYFLGFGADKHQYVKEVWKIINWDIVQERLK